MDEISIETYQGPSGDGLVEIEGEVAGIAIPFSVSDGRPGLWLDEDTGKLTFFDYSMYAPETFSKQLDLPEWGGRVRFMWSHGLEAGMTSIPIGNVTVLQALPDALMFRAQLGKTALAEELRKALAGGSIRETSVKMELRAFTFKVDGAGKTYRHVTRAALFDVSLVAHGQFPQARLLEVHSTSQDDHTTPDDETVTISKRALGELYAYIDRIQVAERLRIAKEVQACQA